MAELMKRIIDIKALPKMFPTHKHEPMFWESLGRAVATFGFLEETLGKAIFALTATKPYSEEEIQKAYESWLPKLQNALSGQLWNLVESYGKAVGEHPDSTKENLGELLDQLKEAAKIRNVICHGSWRAPTAEGASVPFFVSRHQECFETAIDIPFLLQLQEHVCELICAVINTITKMGWQFPGSQGPGAIIGEVDGSPNNLFNTVP